MIAAVHLSPSAPPALADLVLQNRGLCWHTAIVNTELAWTWLRMPVSCQLLFSQQYKYLPNTRQTRQLPIAGVENALELFPETHLTVISSLVFLVLKYLYPFILRNRICWIQYSWLPIFSFSTVNTSCYCFLDLNFSFADLRFIFNFG